MNNLVTTLQSLFGIGEYTKKETSTIPVVRKVFFKSGKWNVINSNVSSNKTAHPESFGMQLLGKGATLKFIQLTSVEMTAAEFEKQFGYAPLATYEGRDKILKQRVVDGLFVWVERIGWDLVKINLGPAVPEAELTHIVKSALEASNTWYLIPAHPSWVFESGMMNMLVSTNKHNLPNEVLIRSGKDIWNEPVIQLASKEKPIKILVLPSQGISWDGNGVLSLKAGKGYNGLTRGVIKISGKYGKLKMRVMSTDMFLDLPNGKPLPEGVDGWITTDNIKWLSKAELNMIVNKVITVYNLNGVKDEDHKVKDGYKFHSLGILFMQCDKQVKETMIQDFHSFWIRGSHKMKNLTVEGMVAALKDETNGFVLSSQAVKVMCGIGTPEDIEAVYKSFAKKFLSKTLKGAEYPMIIFAESWGGVKTTPDSPVWSPELFKRLRRGGKVKEVTLSRYPLLNHQSYLRLNLESTVTYCDIQVDYVVLHPSCAAYIQGDGDDHALVQSVYMSNFRPSSGEKVQVVKPEFRTGNTDEALAYFKGAKAQGSIGYAFNAMLKAKVINNRGMFAAASTAINSFAQGVKKDAILPEASEMISVSREFSDLREDNIGNYEFNLAGLITSKNDAQKFSEFANLLGFEFRLPIPVVTEEVIDRVYNETITTFVKAKQVVYTMTNDCAVSAGFQSFVDLKDAIRKEASLWSVADFIKVSMFFREYAKMSASFRGFTHHRESGLLASQLEGKYLAIYDLLKHRD